MNKMGKYVIPCLPPLASLAFGGTRNPDVVPVKTGNQNTIKTWIPAFAGMTEDGVL